MKLNIFQNHFELVCFPLFHTNVYKINGVYLCKIPQIKKSILVNLLLNLKKILLLHKSKYKT